MSTPHVVSQVVAVLKAIPEMPDNAQCVHAAVLTALHRAGFAVWPEFSIQYGEGESGRIDLIAAIGPARVAIEIDARKPRKKSLRKLVAFDGGRVIALRGVSGARPIQDIDAVIGLRVRLETPAEEKDRAIISRTMRQIRGAA